MRFRLCVAPFAVIMSAACARPVPVPRLTETGESFTLGGQYVVRQAASVAENARIGGLSGLCSLREGRELLAVSDDSDNPRVFRMTVTSGSGAFRVEPSGIVYLGASPAAPPKLDPEGIAVTRDGHLLITSEGASRDKEPRFRPSILEYSNGGEFIRQLPIRPRYLPTERGPLTSGARENAAFEALAMAPDYSRFFTATELPLVQDAETDAFKPGARSRVLEYVAVGGSFEPRREFAYDIEPIEPQPFSHRFAVNGIVELLALEGDVLLSMERGFVESNDMRRSFNRIRIFRIDLAAATDISARESLRGAADIVPVRKTLVLDVNAMKGLAPPLASLDNFEGMTWGAPSDGGKRSLILVSDDNFSERQVTAFLLLRPGRNVGR